MEISQFVLDNCFTGIDTPDGVVYYAYTKHREGWVVIWPDGETLYTYRDPENWLVSNDLS